MEDKGPSLKDKLDQMNEHIASTEAAAIRWGTQKPKSKKQVDWGEELIKLEATKTEARALEDKLAALEAGSLGVVATLLRMPTATMGDCSFVGAVWCNADELRPSNVKCLVHFTHIHVKFRKKAGLLSLRIQTEYHKSKAQPKVDRK